MKKLYAMKNLRGDIFGGVTAGIVALPLSLAFGVQSGMGAIAGLYGAMTLGMLAAIFGGTATQVSGPTGPMTVVAAMVVASAINIAGSLQSGLGIILASFFLAGVFQICFGVFKIGKYIKYMPYPVLSGFMTGIGVLIILYQLYPLMGHASAKSTLDILLSIYKPLSNVNWSSIALGGLTIAIIYIIPKINKLLPGVLLALVISTLVASLLKLNVPLIGHIPSGLPQIKIGQILTVNPSMMWTIIQFAVTLAALGAIDSLLTSVIADNITKTKHKSNRELIGQGIGNIASSIIGGLPGAGATMRTVVNVNSGGKTRLSGFIHGLILMAILLGLGKYTSYIPLSVLSGILITVGFGIIDYRGLRHLRRVPKTDAGILIIVLLITVFGNLLHAVGVGVVLACVLFMKQASDLAENEASVKALARFYNENDKPWDDEANLSNEYKKYIYIKHLYGPFFFGYTARFQELIKSLDENVKVLIIRMGKVPHIDQSGIYALEDAIMMLQANNVVVLLTGVQPQPLDMLKKIDIIPAQIPTMHVFDTFAACEKWLDDNLSNNKDGFEMLLQELHRVKKAKVAYQM
jgi:sulfate permease, SulP family